MHVHRQTCIVHQTHTSEIQQDLKRRPFSPDVEADVKTTTKFSAQDSLMHTKTRKFT